MVSVDGMKLERYLEQRQSMGRDGIHCWMSGVAELVVGMFFTTPTVNYSFVSKRKIPINFWPYFIVFIFNQHFTAKLVFSTWCLMQFPLNRKQAF